MWLRTSIVCFLLVSSSLPYSDQAQAQQDGGSQPSEEEGRGRRGRFQRGQGGPGAMQGMRGGTGAGNLLRNELVREEIGIDESQWESLQELNQEMQGIAREAMMAAREQGNLEDMRSTMMELRSKAEDKLQAILSESQYQRLKQAGLQLQLRTRGLRALGARETADALSLSEDQLEQLGAGRGRPAEGQGATEGRGSRQGRQQRTVLTFDQVRENAAEVLSEEQMASLDKVMGREFDLPEELLTNRGGRAGFAAGRGGPRGQRGGDRQRPERRRSGDDQE